MTWQPSKYKKEELIQLDAAYPSRDVQEELWIAQQSNLSGSATFNEYIGIQIQEAIDLQRLKLAIESLHLGYPALRTIISSDGKFSCIKDTSDKPIIHIFDGMFQDNTNEILKVCHEGFPPVGEPLSKWIIAYSPTETSIILCAHHIICDGMVMDLIFSDLERAYNKPGSIETPSLTGFLNEGISPEDQKISLEFWKKKVKDSSSVNLKYDRDPLEKISEASGICELSLDRNLSIQIYDSAKSQKVSPIAFLMGSLQANITSKTGQKNFSIGLPIARNTDSNIAMLSHQTTMLPISCKLESDTSLGEIIQRAKSSILDAHEYSDTCLMKIIEAVKPKRVAGRMPIINLVLNIDPRSSKSFSGFRHRYMQIPKAFQAFEMFINVVLEEQEIKLFCSYQQELFDYATIEDFLIGFRNCLKEASKNPNHTIKIEDWDNKKQKIKEALSPAIEPLDLPGDFPPRSEDSFLFNSVFRTLSQHQQDALSNFSQENSLSDSILVETAVISSLSRVLRQEAFIVGIQRSKEIVPIGIKTDQKHSFIEACRLYENRISKMELNTSGFKIKDISKILELDSNTNLWDLEIVASYETPQNCKLRFILEEDSLVLSYDSEFWHESTMDNLLDGVINLLDLSLESPFKLINDHDIISDPRVNFENSQTSFLSYFERQVQTNPDAIALIWKDREITYQDLFYRAKSRAKWMVSSGVSKGSYLGIYLDRSDEMLVSMLAVLFAGAAYIPLDPQYPEERIQYMIQQSMMQGIVCSLELLPVQNSVPLYIIENQDSTSEPLPDLDLDQIAYVIYTSGSTGKPKGVSISHRALSNFLETIQETLCLSEDDTILAITTISFDISILELLLPLSVGAKVILGDSNLVADSERIKSKIRDYDVSLLQATPATWTMLVNSGWKGNNDLVGLSGGEALRKDLAMALVPRLKNLWNAYGPTEATVWASLALIDDPNAIHIGKPLRNYQFSILDKNLKSVPKGLPGTLYISGPSLAEGYLNREDLSNERFKEISTIGVRSYDTGDLVRQRTDGNIQYLNRVDSQVKLRGFRIELGEIESEILKFEGVTDCVVSVFGDDPVSQRLVAYLCSDKEHLDWDILKGELSNSLPYYMVPQQSVVMKEFPLTGSGKIDRKRLPKPENQVAEQEEILTDKELLVEDLWKKAIGFEGRASKKDTFFTLGGHSLLAIKFVEELNSRYSTQIHLRDLLAMNLTQLATHLDKKEPKTTKPLKTKKWWQRT